MLLLKSKNIKNKMKIAFFKGKWTFFSFLIRLKTGSSYSHTELVFSDGLAFSSSEEDWGTRFKKIKFKKRNWDFIELNLSKYKENKILSFCKKENKKSYDWKAIFLAQMFNFHSHKKQSWFCSEICTSALQEVGLIPKISPHMVSPNDLYEKLIKEENIVNLEEISLQHSNFSLKHTLINLFWWVLTTLILVFMLSKFIDLQFILKAFLLDL